MEILLLKDVKGLGQAGDIITISDGHARNFLIPNGLACFADEQTKRRAKDASTAKSGAIKKSEERTRKLAKKLGKETLANFIPLQRASASSLVILSPLVTIPA